MKRPNTKVRAARPAPAARIPRVLAPVDFSEASFAALELAASTALQREAELIVMHVASWPAGDLGYLHSPLGKDEALKKLEDAFRERVLERDPRWPPERKPLFLVREGLPPADEILRTIREKGVDLLVMGTHGRSGFSRAVLGSVTEKMIREAPCPVLACRAARPVMEAEVVGRGKKP
jgi:universal stress protein A